MPRRFKDEQRERMLKDREERAERLNEEKAAIAQDFRDLMAEAKANGFDAKALRTIIRMRKQDAAERAEQQAIMRQSENSKKESA